MSPQRDRLQAHLKSHGIPTAVHYPVPLHQQPAYTDLCCPECCGVSTFAAQRVLSLPMSADLTEVQQDRIVAEVMGVLQPAA